MEAELGSVREGLRNENGGGRAGGGARRLGLGVGVARRETDARAGSSSGSPQTRHFLYS